MNTNNSNNNNMLWNKKALQASVDDINKDLKT